MEAGEAHILSLLYRDVKTPNRAKGWGSFVDGAMLVSTDVGDDQ